MAYHLFASFKLHHDLDYRKQDCARYAFFFHINSTFHSYSILNTISFHQRLALKDMRYVIIECITPTKQTLSFDDVK